MDLFTIRRRDKTELKGRRWKAEDEKVILQVIHGALDYSACYGKLGQWMQSRGVTVCAMDTRGHGLNQVPGSDRVIMHKGEGLILADDAIALGKQIRVHHPGKPIILYGHSMGSFVARTVSGRKHPYAGFILAGTSVQRKAMLRMGKSIVQGLSKIKRADAPSELLDQLTFRTYQKNMQRRGLISQYSEWLSADPEEADSIRRDPYLNQRFTVGAYGAMFDAVQQGQRRDTLENADKPILILTGLEDPLSDYGRTINQLVRLYENRSSAQIKSLSYPGMRHEVVSGPLWERVYEDMLEFMTSL